MTIASVPIKVQDNGLGQQNPGSGNLITVIGTGSLTTSVNTPITSAAAGAFVAAAGYGPGPQLAELVLKQSGGPVVFVQSATTTPGSNSVVQTAVGNTSATVMTVTGTPVDTFYAVVTCTQAGTVGTGPVQVTVSIDAGRTTLSTVNLGTATTYVIPNTGLTLSFTAAAMVLGDAFFFVSTEPSSSDASISSAVQALYGLPFGETPIVIYDAGCTATGADVTSFDSDMTALVAKRRYMRRVCAAPDATWGGTSTQAEAAWMTSIEASHVNDSSLRVGVTAGHYNVTSAIDQCQYRRPLSWLAACRNSQVAIQVDLGRVQDGALAPVSIPSVKTWPAPTVAAGSVDGFIYHDEAKSPGLDAARFMTAITYPGFPGFYITDPQLMAPPGSDFQDLDHGEVIDAASLVWYLFATKRLRSGVRVNKSTGLIYEVDRQAIQYQGTQALRNVLTPGNVVTDVYATVSASDNILSTQKLTVTVFVIPLGKLVSIPTTITYLNPALIPV